MILKDRLLLAKYKIINILIIIINYNYIIRIRINIINNKL